MNTSPYANEQLFQCYSSNPQQNKDLQTTVLPEEVALKPIEQVLALKEDKVTIQTKTENKEETVIEETTKETIEEATEEATEEASKDVKEASIQKPEVVKDNRIKVDFLISFYTSLACENTKYGAVDAMSTPLKFGTIAVPKDIPLKSKFYIDGYDYEFEARDRGGKVVWTKGGEMKIDIFIPRKKGESDNAYYKRVNNMGVVKASGYYEPYESKKK